MSSPQPAPAESSPARKSRLTYWQCRRGIRWLERFKFLLIHREGIGIYLQDAPPIEQLLPGVAENDRSRVLEREINRLIPPVTWVLDCLAVSTTVTWTDYRPDLEHPQLATKKFEEDLDLIDNYFELPRNGRQFHQLFRLLLQALERGIGELLEAKRIAIRRSFSPITWLAWLVEIPIKVFERAGVPIEDASSKVAHAFVWVLRLATLALFAFLCAKLGLSVPWDKILAVFK